LNELASALGAKPAREKKGSGFLGLLGR